MPDNKIIYLTVFIVLIVTSVISYSEYKKRVPSVKKDSPSSQQEKLRIVLENNYQSKDSDVDGLFDWEESLWGTDLKNPDTDGDGSKDGEEVALGRDPNKKGPNDQYNDVSGYLEEFKSAQTYDENTLTGRVARSILYNSNLQAGAEGAAKIAEEIKKELSLSTIYKAENLITFDPTGNTAKFEKYSQQLMTIQKEEIATALSAGQTNPESYPTAYKNMSLRLSAIEVPKNLTGLHIDFVNNYYLLSILADRVNKVKSDPLMSLASINAYQELVSSQGLILEQIKLYYKNNGIIFIE